MNDFLLHLASRSFDRTEGMERVRPRLPSFYETSSETKKDFDHDLTDDGFGLMTENTEVDGSLITNPMPSASRNLHSNHRNDPQGKFGPFPENNKRPPFQSVGVTSGPANPPVESESHLTAPSQLPVTPRSHYTNESQLNASTHPMAPLTLQSKPEVEQANLENPLYPPVSAPLKPDNAGKSVGRQKQKAENPAQASPQPTIEKPVTVEKGLRTELVQQTIECWLPSEKTRRESRVPIVDGISIQTITPAIDRGVESGFQQQTPKAEPVIQVTIGRVEVRATVSTQKQTPRRVNRSPVMGLDEYLRRRSGGRDS